MELTATPFLLSISGVLVDAPELDLACELEDLVDHLGDARSVLQDLCELAIVSNDKSDVVASVLFDLGELVVTESLQCPSPALQNPEDNNTIREIAERLYRRLRNTCRSDMRVNADQISILRISL